MLARRSLQLADELAADLAPHGTVQLRLERDTVVEANVEHLREVRLERRLREVLEYGRSALARLVRDDALKSLQNRALADRRPTEKPTEQRGG